MAKYNSRRSGVRAGSKPALAPEPQDCHGALVGLPPHERNGMGHGRPQDMMTMGEGPQQIPPATHSQKRQKMYNRCVRERGGDETAGWLHFRESLAEKRKGKRQRQRQRQRGGEAAKERCQQVLDFYLWTLPPILLFVVQVGPLGCALAALDLGLPEKEWQGEEIGNGGVEEGAGGAKRFAHGSPAAAHHRHQRHHAGYAAEQQGDAQWGRGVGECKRHAQSSPNVEAGPPHRHQRTRVGANAGANGGEPTLWQHGEGGATKAAKERAAAEGGGGGVEEEGAAAEGVAATAKAAEGAAATSARPTRATARMCALRSPTTPANQRSKETAGAHAPHRVEVVELEAKLASASAQLGSLQRSSSGDAGELAEAMRKVGELERGLADLDGGISTDGFLVRPPWLIVGNVVQCQFPEQRHRKDCKKHADAKQRHNWCDCKWWDCKVEEDQKDKGFHVSGWNSKHSKSEDWHEHLVDRTRIRRQEELSYGVVARNLSEELEVVATCTPVGPQLPPTSPTVDGALGAMSIDGALAAMSTAKGQAAVDGQAGVDEAAQLGAEGQEAVDGAPQLGEEEQAAANGVAGAQAEVAAAHASRKCHTLAPAQKALGEAETKAHGAADEAAANGEMARVAAEEQAAADEAPRPAAGEQAGDDAVAATQAALAAAGAQGEEYAERRRTNIARNQAELKALGLLKPNQAAKPKPKKLQPKGGQAIKPKSNRGGWSDGEIKEMEFMGSWVEIMRALATKFGEGPSSLGEVDEAVVWTSPSNLMLRCSGATSCNKATRFTAGCVLGHCDSLVSLSARNDSTEGRKSHLFLLALCQMMHPMLNGSSCLLQEVLCICENAHHFKTRILDKLEGDASHIELVCSSGETRAILSRQWREGHGDNVQHPCQKKAKRRVEDLVKEKLRHDGASMETLEGMLPGLTPETSRRYVAACKEIFTRQEQAPFIVDIMIQLLMTPRQSDFQSMLCAQKASSVTSAFPGGALHAMVWCLERCAHPEHQGGCPILRVSEYTHNKQCTQHALRDFVEHLMKVYGVEPTDKSTGRSSMCVASELRECTIRGVEECGGVAPWVKGSLLVGGGPTPTTNICGVKVVMIAKLFAYVCVGKHANCEIPKGLRFASDTKVAARILHLEVHPGCSVKARTWDAFLELGVASKWGLVPSANQGALEETGQFRYCKYLTQLKEKCTDLEKLEKKRMADIRGRSKSWAQDAVQDGVCCSNMLEGMMSQWDGLDVGNSTHRQALREGMRFHLEVQHTAPMEPPLGALVVATIVEDATVLIPDHDPKTFPCAWISESGQVFVRMLDLLCGSCTTFWCHVAQTVQLLGATLKPGTGSRRQSVATIAIGATRPQAMGFAASAANGVEGVLKGMVDRELAVCYWATSKAGEPLMELDFETPQSPRPCGVPQAVAPDAPSPPLTPPHEAAPAEAAPSAPSALPSFEPSSAPSAQPSF